jgi:hypothetical protein
VPETKSLWQSKTFWGGIVMFLAFALKFLGVELSPEETAAATTSLTDAAVAVGNIIGLVLVIVGRKKATAAIK